MLYGIIYDYIFGIEISIIELEERRIYCIWNGYCLIGGGGEEFLGRKVRIFRKKKVVG